MCFSQMKGFETLFAGRGPSRFDVKVCASGAVDENRIFRRGRFSFGAVACVSIVAPFTCVLCVLCVGESFALSAFLV